LRLGGNAVEPDRAADRRHLLRGAEPAQQAVVAPTPDERLGIGGDLILEADGQPAQREDSLVRILSRKRVGDTLNLTILRDGRTMRVRVKLMRAPFE